MSVKVEKLGIIDSKEAVKITLTNKNNISISLLNLGATWQEFLVPDGQENFKNIILGFDNPRDYLTNGLCAGQTIGRVAGRIRGGQLKLGRKKFQLPKNDGENTLHGGPQGVHRQIWNYIISSSDEGMTVTFTYRVCESYDSFPSDYDIEAKYTLTHDNRVRITYAVKNVSGDTVFNPTNHVYFNLGREQHLNYHKLTIVSNQYLETTEDLIPTGKIMDLRGTPYDFRRGENLGERICETNGFDDTFMVTPSLDKAQAVLEHLQSREKIELFSDRNAIVVYTMGGIPKRIYPSRDFGREAKEFEAVALESQFPPDAVHHSKFGDIFLKEGETKKYHIEFRYSKC